MHNWENQHQPPLTPARGGLVPFAVESGGEAQTSNLSCWGWAAEALPVPHAALNSCSGSPWQLTGLHPPWGSPADVPVGTQGCHQGCPWLPGDPWACFPWQLSQCSGAVHWKPALCWVFVGSGNPLLVPGPHSLFPGNRAVSGFPPADAQPAGTAGQSPHPLPCCRLCLTLHWNLNSMDK